MPAVPSSDREAFWRQLFARRASLRLTVVEACEQAGVSPASFFHWQRKLREADRPSGQALSSATSLLPVRIVDDRASELTLEIPPGLCVRLPGDCDEATLVRVLRAARAACRE